MPHFSGRPLSRRLSPSLPVALCGVMLSLLSTAPLQALPTDEGATQATATQATVLVLQQTLGGGAATQPSLRGETFEQRCEYYVRVNHALEGLGLLVCYASGSQLMANLKEQRETVEELESQYRTLPQDPAVGTVQPMFEDLVGFVCREMVPPVVQRARHQAQAFLLGPRTELWPNIKNQSCPVFLHTPRYDEKNWGVVKHDSFDPFIRLWRQSPSSFTGALPQGEEAQSPGAKKTVEAIFEKCYEALPLIDQASLEARIKNQEFLVGVKKGLVDAAQKQLDASVNRALGIFGDVPQNSEGRPMTTYEEVIELFGGHPGPDRCYDTVFLSDAMRSKKHAVMGLQSQLRDAEEELAKLRTFTPSEEERRQAIFWCKTAAWLQGLTPVLVKIYELEADAVLKAASASQPVS